jgi:hypothetical protein
MRSASGTTAIAASTFNSALACRLPFKPRFGISHHVDMNAPAAAPSVFQP